MLKNRSVQLAAVMMIVALVGSLSLFLTRHSIINDANKSLEKSRSVEYRDSRIENVKEVTGSRAQVSDITGGEGILLPTKDPNLPKENRIRIPYLGIDAPIDRSGSSDESLRYSAWMPNDFNTPSGKWLVEGSPPIIIASHLFGYPDWTEDLREKIAFAGLDRVPEGELIEVIWQQRSYKYRVTGGEVATQIGDYSHDLIVYTCVNLKGSEERIFKYAEQVTDLI